MRQLDIDPAVVVPRGVEQLHHPDTPFDQPAGHEAISRERAEQSDTAPVAALNLRFVAIDAIQVEGLLRFAPEIHQLRRRHLHLVSQLVGRNPAVNFRIPDRLLSQGVQFGDTLNAPVLHLVRDARRVVDVQHRRSLVAEQHPGILARQIAARPARRTTRDATTGRDKHYELRQIFRRGPEAVTQPGTHAWPAGNGRSGVHQQLAGNVVELISVHRTHEADVVRDRADVRDQIRQLHAALPVPLECSGRPHHARRLLREECEAHVFQHRLGQRLAVELVQGRLRIVKIHLARPALQIDVDAALRAGLVVRLARRPGQQPITTQQIRQRESTDHNAPRNRTQRGPSVTVVQGQLVSVQRLQRLHFRRSRRAAHAQLEAALQLRINRPRSGAELPAEGLAALEENRIVEQRERLERRIRSFTLETCGGRVRGIEGQQHRIRNVATQMNVEPAAVLVGSRGRRPGGVAADRRDVGGQRRINARTADPRVEQSTGGEKIVANHLGFESVAILPGEQRVQRIAVHQFRA